MEPNNSSVENSISKQTKKKTIKDIEQFIDSVDAYPDEELRCLRLKIRELREFYKSLLIYGIVCVLSIIVWLSMGAGVFWPIWVILGCGINVGLKALTLGQLPWVEECFPFLGSKWEDDQFEKNISSKAFCVSKEDKNKKNDF
ncbi:MAG: 2TM domain-containing protein [Candidatus Paracaedibacteraceae bacterium]|nr:2TM domain-containing protein [Candidatus Paracaedibacteraceae bacterium]